MQKISNDTFFQIISELAAIRAPSGLEEPRVLAFVNYISKYISRDSIEIDNLKNVIIKIPSPINTSEKKTNSKKIMLVGHIDEIGATVLKIKDDGRILMQKRGGIETRWLISKQVQILSLSGKWISGIIIGRTIHAIPESIRGKSVPEITELEIFIGAESGSDVKNLGIHVGAPIVFEGYTSYLNTALDKDLILSNSLDDILSLCVFIEILARLQEKNPFNVDLLLVAASREEIGREGSLIVAQKYLPDICIGIDFGTVENSKDAIESGCKIRGGPMIVWAEESGAGILDYNLAKEFMIVAEKRGIPFQNAIMTFYGSDAGIIQKRLGIPSVLIAPPMLAGHNVPEIMALSEISKCVDLIWNWLETK